MQTAGQTGSRLRSPHTDPVIHLFKTYRKDGTARAIWSGPRAAVFRQHGVLPVRGSHVIAIAEGPHRGWFHVDFSPLADATKNECYRVCLTRVFECHEDAVDAEQKWLITNWVTEDDCYHP